MAKSVSGHNSRTRFYRFSLKKSYASFFGFFSVFGQIVGANSLEKFENLDFEVENLIYDTDDLDSHPNPIVQSNPAFPSALKRGGIEGFVEVVFVVTANGKVRNIRISKASHREFAESVRNALRQWNFEPGKLDNKAVATRVRQSFLFTFK